MFLYFFDNNINASNSPKQFQNLRVLESEFVSKSCSLILSFLNTSFLMYFSLPGIVSPLRDYEDQVTHL